jgi:hypothetical protein
MSAQAIGKRMVIGFPGSFTRSSDTVVVNRVSASEIPFGGAVKLNGDNTVAAFDATGTVDNFVGVAVRIVKQQQSIFEKVGSYRNGELSDVLVRGSIAVSFAGTGTPTAGGPVYVRITLNSALPNAKIGDIEAAGDGVNSVKLTNARFTTGIVDNELVEITVTERRI